MIPGIKNKSISFQTPRHTFTVPIKLRIRKISAAATRQIPSKRSQAALMNGCNANVTATIPYPIT